MQNRPSSKLSSATVYLCDLGQAGYALRASVFSSVKWVRMAYCACWEELKSPCTRGPGIEQVIKKKPTPTLGACAVPYMLLSARPWQCPDSCPPHVSQAVT